MIFLNRQAVSYGTPSDRTTLVRFTDHAERIRSKSAHNTTAILGNN